MLEDKESQVDESHTFFESNVYVFVRLSDAVDRNAVHPASTSWGPISLSLSLSTHTQTHIHTLARTHAHARAHTHRQADRQSDRQTDMRPPLLNRSSAFFFFGVFWDCSLYSSLRLSVATSFTPHQIVMDFYS